MKKINYALAVLILFLLSNCSASKIVKNSADETSPFQNAIVGKEKYSGFIDYYYDYQKGKVYLEIKNLKQDFLYVNYLSAGLGSNDIGLDRGQIGNSRIVRFERIGNKVFLFEENYRYRAFSDNEDEVKAVGDAFARSILHAFPIIAEEEWSILVDATDFLLDDKHGVSDRLKNQKRGNYSLDKNRSAFNQDDSKNFPLNTEIDIWLTFKGKSSSSELNSVVPTNDAITIRQHHSFVELPDDEFTPREFDPRAGYFSTSYQDYTTPIEEDITKRFINRHRLIKKNPEEKYSEVVEPIIYYLDRGTPEPVRSALLEGGNWWAQAFESAGFLNAFEVRMLPEDADPLDIRYNVIQWVHRKTRGWSYGASVVDPRTGEIIKGHVSLGSLRVRQDFLIAEGLLAPYNGKEDIGRMQEMALARLRQLSAHEIGHTLGLAHNYTASVNNDASVMDYPHPNIDFTEQGDLSVADAYDKNIGEWDKIAIQYGYTQIPAGINQEDSLESILHSATEQGLLFISDYDARPISGAHPLAHLWDNGKDPVIQLNKLLKIRNKALQNFDEHVIPEGEPLSKLQEALVPIYFLHRYQIEAAAKVIGGVDYTYKVKGDKQESMHIVNADWQLEAINSFKEVLSPKNLIIPERIVSILYPRPLGYYNDRELIKGSTGPIFDAIAPAEQLTHKVLSVVLNADRLNRMHEFAGRNEIYPSPEYLLNELHDGLFKKSVDNNYQLLIQHATQRLYVNHLLKALQSEAYARVKPAILNAIDAIERTIKDTSYKRNQSAQTEFLLFQINEFKKAPLDFKIDLPQNLPPGSPIGMDCY